VRLVAEHACERRIDVDEASVAPVAQVRQRDPDRGVGEGGAKALLGGTPGELGGVALGVRSRVTLP
jgi:hypothetical protein